MKQAEAKKDLKKIFRMLWRAKAKILKNEVNQETGTVGKKYFRTKRRK